MSVLLCFVFLFFRFFKVGVLGDGDLPLFRRFKEHSVLLICAREKKSKFGGPDIGTGLFTSTVFFC